MKRILFALAIFTLVSCSKTDKPQENTPVIMFSPGIVAKSYVTAATDPEFREGFAVFASKTDVNGKSAEIMSNLRVYSPGTAWIYDGPEIFWGPNCNHLFLGVYPHKVTDASDFDGNDYVFRDLNTIGADGTDTGIDIMYGRYSDFYKYGTTPSTVRLHMRHALSAFTFKVRNASENDIESITDISFGRLVSVVKELRLPRDKSEGATMVVDTTRGSFKFPNLQTQIPTGDTKPRILCGPSIIVPQDFLDISLPLKFKVKFKDIPNPKEVAYDIASIPLETDIPEYHYTYRPGVHYIYNINITNNYITCEVTVVDWIEDKPIELL